MAQELYMATRLGSKLLPSLGFAFLLTACGGGGGGGGGTTATPVQPANQPPSALISAPGTAQAGVQVTLDGSGSSDGDGSITAYQWRQTEGPTVTLDGASTATARFTAPPVSGDTALAFSLTVTDNDGANGSATVTLTIAGTANGVSWTLSGSVLASSSQAVDGDTNDTASLYTPNDTLSSAQELANPVTLGGYVNQPGAGAEGRSQISGDVDDYFRLTLLEGQSVTLLVADFEDADADLYLYNESGDVIDFSVETGEIEAVTAPENGTYLANVTAFVGGTNYILAVGSQALPTARADAEVVPGEIVMEFADSAVLAPGFFDADLAYQMGMRERAGGPGRARLLEIIANQAERQRLGSAAHRRDHFRTAQAKARWETLVSVKNLRQRPGVHYAEPNYRVRPALEPNDSAYPLQWHYPLIGLPAAWDVTVGDPGVIVAVIDTGIFSGHPDLAGQLVPGYDFVRDPTADGNGIDPNPEDPGDQANPGNSRFHGTHVAGTVAARGNNRIGVAGVAWGARIMPLRALDDGGGTSYDVAQAVRFAAGLANDSGTLPASPAAIINLSLSGEGFSQVNQALYREVRDLGIIVVASAGNEATDAPAYPAAYDAVIGVSAVDAQRELASYSNRGIAVDIAAPGGDGSTDFNGDGYPDGVLSTSGSIDAGSVEFAYTFLNGTSMAAPHVAGVMALMKSINPDLTGRQVESLLQSGSLTDDLGSPGRDDNYGHGLINARKAVEAALASIGQVFTPPAALRASSQSLNFGSTREQLEITFSNGGSGNLRVLGVSSDASWLSIAPLDIDNSGLGRYRLQVERRGLADGLYAATVTARSSANGLQVRALLSVGDAAVADVGILYIIVYDPAVDAPVAQRIARVEAGRYAYRFPDLAAGRYQLFAGTDADNDLFICDVGEACGAWLNTDEPGLITLDQDRNNIDFPIEHFIRLPGAADVDGDSNGDGGTAKTRVGVPRLN